MAKVIVLIATRPDVDVVLKFALPSVLLQKRRPDSIVIVSDSRPMTPLEQYQIKSQAKDIPLFILNNTRLKGAPGTWNTGIVFIHEKFGNCYTAILDDDDRWAITHLFLCEQIGDRLNADVVLSGINTVVDNHVITQSIPLDITINDFLVGNPGWQGSNTFVRNGLLKLVGFTDGLVSSNDKDLAIRVLSNPLINIAYTGCATVDWTCNASSGALSAKGSVQKLKGCAQFLKLHGHRMNERQEAQYFERMVQLFDLSKTDILSEYSRMM